MEDFQSFMHGFAASVRDDERARIPLAPRPISFPSGRPRLARRVPTTLTFRSRSHLV
jgi:hypothetical protein